MDTLRGNNLKNVKKQNEASIRLAIHRYGPISRTDIAEMLSLTPPTITTNVASLIKQGLVMEMGNRVGSGEEHGLGRKPVLIDFKPNCCYAVGVELGPYETAYSLAGLRGQIIKNEISQAADDDYGLMLEKVTQNVKRILAESGVDQSAVAGIGIGVPGFVEKTHGILRTGSKLDWVNRSIAEDFEKRLSLPVKIENNVRMRACGEELFAVLTRPDSFAYFFVSRGIACPMIIHDGFHVESSIGAGEIGHMVMQRNGAVCKTCGNHGCLEAVAGEQAIIDRCKEAINNGISTLLRDICVNPEDITMGDILKAQRMDDRIVCAILYEAITYLGIALANIINFITPEMVIVDGYIMKNKVNRDLFLEVANSNMFIPDSRSVGIEFVEFDHYRGAIGAAAYAINEFFLK